MTNMTERTAIPNTTGIVLHQSLGYDLLVWVLSLGREQAYRENTLNLAGLKIGEAVLDVGCGTGNLAIAASRRVGPTGSVFGIDASPEMIARARKKATKAAVAVTFQDAVVEKLPFPDEAFDVVFCTTMLHHLPTQARYQCLREIRRVLRPGGRLLVVDFGGPLSERRSWVAKFHRHGRIDLHRIIPLLSEIGLNTIQSGPMEQRFGLMGDLHFVLAITPTAA